MEGIFKIGWWPARCLRYMGNRINDVPHGIAISTLISKQPRHQTNEVGIYEVMTKKSHTIVIDPLFGNLFW